MDEKDDKKGDKKEPSGNPAEEGFLILFVAILGVALVVRAIAFFSPNGTGQSASGTYFETITGGPNGWFANMLHFITVGVSIYVMFATIFSIVVFLVILYVVWL